MINKQDIEIFDYPADVTLYDCVLSYKVIRRHAEEPVLELIGITSSGGEAVPVLSVGVSDRRELEEFATRYAIETCGLS